MTYTKPKLTVGYNCTGLDFFYTIARYRSYIEEFYFSFRHTMPQKPLDMDMVYDELMSANAYFVPSNLLLNAAYEEDEWEFLIKKAYECTRLEAVSVLTIDTAKKIKYKFPDLKIHISTHGAPYINPHDLTSSLIYCVNINEPEYYSEQQQNIINICRRRNIKLKYIANRGCILGKSATMSKFLNKRCECCNKECRQIFKNYPWTNLIRTNIFKESLPYLNFDLIKLSTRENSNDEIRSMLQYWTSEERTRRAYNLLITDNNYNVFVDWCKTRFSCDGNCLTCNKCAEYYEYLSKL